jgi:hypothetical protein
MVLLPITILYLLRRCLEMPAERSLLVYSDSVIEESRRLRGLTEVDRSWLKAARDMFKMASTALYDLGPVQVLRRRD